MWSYGSTSWMLRHRALLHRRLGVFLAHVPVERELVAEPRDQLADVQAALRSGVTAVERRRHRTWCRPLHRPPRARSTSALSARRRWPAAVAAGGVPAAAAVRSAASRRRATGRGTGCATAASATPATATTAARRAVVVLLLLELEVQVDALRLRVIEHDLPLIQLGHVVVELVVAIDERPDVVAVSPRRLRHERHRVHAFRRQVVDGADQRFALGLGPRWDRRSSSPGRAARSAWIAVLSVRVLSKSSYASSVSGESGPAFRNAHRSRESQVVLADVLQPPFRTEVWCGLVRRRDLERSGGAVHRGDRLPGRRWRGGHVCPETNDARQFHLPTLSGET